MNKINTPSRPAMPDLSTPNPDPSLSEAESRIIDLFAGFIQVLGFPKSLGQIYGYLFAQSDPKTMEQIIRSLGISLGSASQGLKALRRIGAVKADYLPGTRRDVFVAELEFKKLMGGFVREQFLPHLQDGKSNLDKLEESITKVEDRRRRAALQERLRKLRDWQRKAKRIAPLLELAFGK